MINKDIAEAFQNAILELYSIIESRKQILDAVNAAAKHIPEAPELTFTTPVPLTLEQIKKMDGQRVLIPETTAMFGGFGIVNARENRVESPNPEYNGWWDFCHYKICWIAYKDPFGVVGENHDE